MNNSPTPITGTNTNNVSKTWALLQTTGGKDELNIVFQVGIFWGFALIFQFCGVDVTRNVGDTWRYT